MVRHLAFLAAVIGAWGFAYAVFGSLVPEVIRFSPPTTAAFGLITFLILVVPMCLFVPLALNVVREAIRSPGLAQVAPLAALPLAGVLGVMITPGAVGLWMTGPIAALVTGAVVLSLAAGLRLGMRPTLPLLVRVAAGTVGFGLVGFAALVSSLFWLVLPFSLAMIPVVVILAPCGVFVTLAWWLLLGATAPDVAVANRRLTNAIGACVVAGLALDGAMYGVLASRTRTLVHQVRWEPGGTPDPRCGARVVLRDESCSALTRMVCSDEVARYLESAGSATVPVTYSITDDFGKVWSYTIRSIGPVRFELKSDESVKRNDVGCLFLP
jgi:hypothetical protein